jgi:predicted outer membrane protein
MTLVRLRHLRFVLGALLILMSAFAQKPYDPYNPRNQRNPTPPEPPSLIDMGSGTDQGNIGPFVTISDKQFAGMTAMRAMVELQLAEIAITNSGRTDVKMLARQMVDYHTAWELRIRRAAERLKIQLPSTIEAKQRGTVERMSALFGSQFDEAYMKEIIHFQQRALTVTQYEAENASITEFREWAGIMISDLQKQVWMARITLSAGRK